MKWQPPNSDSSPLFSRKNVKNASRPLGGGRDAEPWCCTTCVGTGLLLRAPARDGARASSVIPEGQTKRPFPSSSCGQSLGGLHTPASPEPDSSNPPSTQGKIKTDGAACVSLVNEQGWGGAACRPVLFGPGCVRAFPREPQHLGRSKQSVATSLSCPLKRNLVFPSPPTLLCQGIVL